MDSSWQDDINFEGSEVYEIFDWDLIEDPDHPKLVQGIRANKDVFFEQFSRRNRMPKRALWQGSLFIFLVLVVVYSWRAAFLLTTAWPLESSMNATKIRVAILPNKENIEFQQGTEPSLERPVVIEDSVLESMPGIDGVSVIDEIIEIQELDEVKSRIPIVDKAQIEVSSLQNLSYRQSVKAYVEELNSSATFSAGNTRSEESAIFLGVPLKNATVVFDSGLKAKLESAYVADINSQTKSGRKDVYTDVYGSDVSRSGNICATTIRNPGVGEWTYYNACTQPPDKLRRFGREVYKSGLSKESPRH